MLEDTRIAHDEIITFASQVLSTLRQPGSQPYSMSILISLLYRVACMSDSDDPIELGAHCRQTDLVIACVGVRKRPRATSDSDDPIELANHGRQTAWEVQNVPLRSAIEQPMQPSATASARPAVHCALRAPPSCFPNPDNCWCINRHVLWNATPMAETDHQAILDARALRAVRRVVMPLASAVTLAHGI